MSRFYSETEIVARVEGLTVARLRAFVAADCLAPAEREGRLAFAEADLARVRLLAELVTDFDLDAEAAGMVVSLVDQIHGLRRALRQLGEAVAAEPGEVRERIRSRLAADPSGAGADLDVRMVVVGSRAARLVVRRRTMRTGPARGRRLAMPPQTPRCTRRWRSSTAAIRTSTSPAR